MVLMGPLGWPSTACTGPLATQGHPTALSSPREYRSASDGHATGQPGRTLRGSCSHCSLKQPNSRPTTSRTSLPPPSLEVKRSALAHHPSIIFPNSPLESSQRTLPWARCVASSCPISRVSTKRADCVPRELVLPGALASRDTDVTKIIRDLGQTGAGRVRLTGSGPNCAHCAGSGYRPVLFWFPGMGGGRWGAGAPYGPLHCPQASCFCQGAPTTRRGFGCTGLVSYGQPGQWVAGGQPCSLDSTPCLRLLEGPTLGLEFTQVPRCLGPRRREPS